MSVFGPTGFLLPALHEEVARRASQRPGDPGAPVGADFRTDRGKRQIPASANGWKARSLPAPLVSRRRKRVFLNKSLKVLCGKHHSPCNRARDFRSCPTVIASRKALELLQFRPDFVNLALNRLQKVAHVPSPTPVVVQLKEPGPHNNVRFCYVSR